MHEAGTSVSPGCRTVLIVKCSGHRGSGRGKIALSKLQRRAIDVTQTGWIVNGGVSVGRRTIERTASTLRSGTRVKRVQKVRHLCRSRSNQYKRSKERDELPVRQQSLLDSGRRANVERRD
jgi:hypothetical protein